LYTVVCYSGLMNKFIGSFLNSWNKYWYFYILGLAVLFFLIYFVFYLNWGYGWDESVYLVHTDIFLGRQSIFNELAFRPITISLFIIPFYLISKNIAFLHVVMLFCFCFAMFLLFVLLKKLFNSKVASVMVALFCISPLILSTCQFVLTDIFVFVFIIPAIYFSYLFYDSKKSKFIIFASILFALAFLTRFLCGIFILVILLVILLDFRFKWLDIKLFCYRVFLCIITFVVIISPYFIFVKLRFGDFLHTIVAGRLLVNFYDAPWYVYITNIITLWPVFLIFGLVGVYYLYKSKFFMAFNDKLKNYNLEKFVFVLFIVFILQFIYLGITPHKEPRYTISLILPFSIVGAYGCYKFLAFLKVQSQRKIVLLKKLLLFCFGLAIVLGSVVFITFCVKYPTDNFNVGMKPIDYLQNNDFNGKLYVNSDVPQYFYLFNNNEVINLYYYNLNNLNYKVLFDEQGIFVYNTYNVMDLNNLPVTLVPIKEIFPYIIYDVKIN